MAAVFQLQEVTERRNVIGLCKPDLVDDLGVNSLAMAEVIALLDESGDVDLDEFAHLRTVGNLIALDDRSS